MKTSLVAALLSALQVKRSCEKLMCVKYLAGNEIKNVQFTFCDLHHLHWIIHKSGICLSGIVLLDHDMFS